MNRGGQEGVVLVRMYVSKIRTYLSNKKVHLMTNHKSSKQSVQMQTVKPSVLHKSNTMTLFK
jgi:hypothetical protein